MRLPFGLIDKRAADILTLDIESIRDHHVAELLGVSRETVSRWRNGQQPGLPAVRNISAVFGISVGVLTGEPGAGGQA